MRNTFRQFILTAPTAALLLSPPSMPERNSDESFTIHFAFNSARLEKAERVTVIRAAERARQVAVSRITVTGHADSSGSAEYNLTLSRRRAETVSRALREQGIQAGVLHADWKGEFEPSSPQTQSDSLQRRVTITLHF